MLEPLATPRATESTIALIKLGFIAPRKKLLTNLTIGLKLPREDLQSYFAELNLSENTRPADLSIEQWCALEKLVHKH